MPLEELPRIDDRGEVGAAIPGFRVVTAQRPRLLVVAGRHRFSRYGIVVRVDDVDEGVRCRVESRAAFPPLPGAFYRLAVVGTGCHATAVERLVREIARAAVRRRAAGQRSARAGRRSAWTDGARRGGQDADVRALPFRTGRRAGRPLFRFAHPL